MILARLFVVIGSLIVLALTAALVGPYFIDWTNYRADFEREATAILGRRVTVHGSASARLLPFPSVTFSDVSVAGGPNGEPAMTIETFSMDAELAPFMRGEVLIFDMRMVRPNVVVDIAEDGTVDWSVRPSTPPAISSVAIERLSVTDGRIELHHRPSGRTHIVDGLQAEVSARALRGPWRMEGTAQLDGLPVRLALSTTPPGTDGNIRVRTRVTPVSSGGVAIEADGAVAQGEDGPSYAGTFTLTERPSDKGDRTPSKEAPAPGFRVTGDFALTSDRLDIGSFRFETGPLDNPYTAEGKALVEFGREPRFSIEADGAQVRLDEAIGGEGTTLTLGERLAGFRDVLASVPRLPIPGEVSVNLPAVLVGDTTVRDVRLSAEPAEGGWNVRSAAATLPGRATLEAEGFLHTDETLGFDGSLLLAVGQPSGFAAWLAKDIDEAIRRLPKAGFSAKVVLTPERQQFNDLELILGEARFTGEIESRQPANARPAAYVRLEGGAVDEATLSALASLLVNDSGNARFPEMGVDAEIGAGPVTIAGLTAGRVDTALRLRRAQLEIDRLSISDLAGASVSATGSLSDFPDRPAGQIDASIISVDLEPLVTAAATAHPESPVIAGIARHLTSHPGLLADARIDVVASLATDKDDKASLAVSLQGEAGGTLLSANLSSSGNPARPRDMPFSLTLSARNAEGAPLLALAGLPVLPVASPGGGELALSLDGSLAGGMKSKAELRGEGLLATFSGATSLDDDGTSAKGAVRLSSSDIEPWLLSLGASYPGLGLGLAVELDAQADFANDLLVLEGIRGALGEVSVAGDLNVRLANGQRDISGALVLDEITLDPFAETVFGQEALSPSERMWPEAPFSPAAAPPFFADVGITASRVHAGGADLSDASFTLKLDREGLGINDLRAAYAGGRLTGRGELKNPSGTGILSAQFALEDARLASDGLSANVSVAGTVTGSGKSLESLVGSLAGSGTIHLADVAIRGLNAGAFPELLARADAVGRDISAAAINSFAPELVAAGPFEGGSADIAYTIAAGVLRAPPVTMHDGETSLTAEPRIDLNNASLSLTGTLTYDAGDAAVTGAVPEVNFEVAGPIGQAEISYDIVPLTQFLTQRALEKEQARVEAMQAVLLEGQRLRREARYYAALQAERERKAAEERRAAEEAARQKALEEYERRAAAQRDLEERLRREAEERRRIETEGKGGSDAVPPPRTETVPEPEGPRAEAGPAEVAPSDPDLPAEVPLPRRQSPARTQPAPRPAEPAADAFPAAPPRPGLIEGFLRSLTNP